MTVDALKRMLCRMALMGYNEAYLYTEDTYALPEYPFFGYQRGRYGAEDLRALDGWAAALGIELIPCRRWGIWNVFCIGKAARLCGIRRMCCWPGTRKPTG